MQAKQLLGQCTEDKCGNGTLAHSDSHVQTVTISVSTSYTGIIHSASTADHFRKKTTWQQQRKSRINTVNHTWHLLVGPKYRKTYCLKKNFIKYLASCGIQIVRIKKKDISTTNYEMPVQKSTLHSPVRC